MLSDTGLTVGEFWLLAGIVLQLGIIIPSCNLAMAHPIPGESIGASKHLAWDIDNLETPAQGLLLEADQAWVVNGVKVAVGQETEEGHVVCTEDELGAPQGEVLGLL